MSQRIKRAKERKQDTGFASMATGGYVTQHSPITQPVVRVPQKVTGDIKPEIPQGLAKASPFFKKLEDVLPKSKIEEAKAIAEASIPVVKAEEEETEEDE